jgi:hypothetical protein
MSGKPTVAKRIKTMLDKVNNHNIIKMNLRQRTAANKMYDDKVKVVKELNRIDNEIKQYLGAIIDGKSLDGDFKYDRPKGALIRIEAEDPEELTQSDVDHTEAQPNNVVKMN